ncbi:MAG: hypothetical protein KJ792_16270 [Actinobacteria bacterium]|nr:hypothetical protein [Actinomycetota bacterium]
MSDIEHEVCGLAEVDVRTLRAWARATAFGLAAGPVPKDELIHAVEHFTTIRKATGHPLCGIDASCLEMLHDELAAL